MPKFQLTPEQLGEIASDGTIAKHPELDIFGSPYEARSATRKRLKLGGKRVFVVIPPGKDSDDNTYELAQPLPTRTTPKSEG